MDIRLNLLFRGTLDMLVLQILIGGELHGYGVARAIENRSEGVIAIDDGALYQSLHRLEDRGFVESAWGHAESGKRARFYRLTPLGRRQLGSETESWAIYVSAVNKVLQPSGS